MNIRKYKPNLIEKKCQKLWNKTRVFEPDLKKARKPFYNLMMFPYPSAEGLHVGNMYAFTGADIYGRFKKMQGYDVFEPIGLDGFGIHSENFALKTNQHPADLAKITQKNFYKQLKSTGNAYAWQEKLETYNPNYYKWTQWLFLQLYKAGLAYQKEAPVNFCPSCKTVLSDEQVIQDACERCDSKVETKFLKQWFFKITSYAEPLLKNLDKIDWSEKVKIAQSHWIGKSEGSQIKFQVVQPGVRKFLLLHGRNSSPNSYFLPWLKKSLEKVGFEVQVPKLPHPEEPNDQEQTEYVLKHYKPGKDTVVVGISFGGVVGLRLLEKGVKINRLVLVATPFSGKFLDNKPRLSVTEACQKGFDFQKIKKNAELFTLLYDTNDKVVPIADGEALATKLGVNLLKVKSQASHFSAKEEPEVLKVCNWTIDVFTTRIDTIFGATYLALSPFYELIRNGFLPINREAKKYVDQAFKKVKNENKTQKEGVFSGLWAINPANNEKIPIWITDYVLVSYGTGAIMAVPAHDKRDFEFAQKYKLKILKVIQPPFKTTSDTVGKNNFYEGEGILINSKSFNGLKSLLAREKILKWLKQRGIAKKTVFYHLRDWIISRQRYWGPPIPIVYCQKCGTLPVPEKDLPIKLPYIKDFKPLGTGKSPLANHPEFYKTKCPKCKGEAIRETDVSDTFLDSSWYYLAYLLLSQKAKTKKRNLSWQFKKQMPLIKKWLPVDMYIGGAEHSVLHLMYARFIAMALKDMGLVHFDEPFKKFRAHGLLISQGAKISKSRGNIINPDQYIKKYGADTFRMYLMFLGPFEQGGDFKDEGIIGIYRFLNRVWNQVIGYKSKIKTKKLADDKNKISTLNKIMHLTIKKVTEDIENLQYNTAISQLMIYQNYLTRNKEQVTFTHIKTLLLLLAPFAPHISEELYQILQGKIKHLKLKKKISIFLEQWPRYDAKITKEKVFKLVIQINGKVRDIIEAEVDISENQAKELALKSPIIQKWLQNKEIVKVFYIPNKVLNFLTK